MNIHLFGATTPTGEALHQLVDKDLYGYSRKSCSVNGWLHHVDLHDPKEFHPVGSPDIPSIWISFAPIWFFASFFEYLSINYPERLRGLRGVIACSSSSSVTKRFASNRFDRDLVDRLISAEEQLLSASRRISLKCCILRPTMIYGKVGKYMDQNLSIVLRQMSRFPFLPLPTGAGLRQPIHATQLAAVALHVSQQFHCIESKSSLPDCIELGGDSTLSYTEMIRSLQRAQPAGHPAHSCRVLLIPNRIFFFFAAPLFLSSPKAFEAVLRIGANLSGFTPVHHLLGNEPLPFPVLPLA